MKTCGAEVAIRGRCLADAETLHAGEAGAIGERERLVLVAQHPLPSLGKKIGSDPGEVHDSRAVNQIEKAAPLVGNFPGDKEGAGLVHDVIRDDQPAPVLLGQRAHRHVPRIALVDPCIDAAGIEKDGPLSHRGQRRCSHC